MYFFLYDDIFVSDLRSNQWRVRAYLGVRSSGICDPVHRPKYKRDQFNTTNEPVNNPQAQAQAHYKHSLGRMILRRIQPREASQNRLCKRLYWIRTHIIEEQLCTGMREVFNSKVELRDGVVWGRFWSIGWGKRCLGDWFVGRRRWWWWHSS